MRRALIGMACVAVLVLMGTSTAMAKGPHHGGHGHGRGGHGNWNRGGHHQAYRPAPRGPICRPPVCRPPVCGPVAAYPVYPVPVVTAYQPSPRLGFGLGGSNFSFWYQQ